MVIDWKTILSEFDGKPTLLQAIGKLMKAVEEETITIQQVQAEIAKLESQQKADEALLKTKQDKLNDKSDVTVLYLTATNGINAGTVKAGEVSDDEDNMYNFPKKSGTFALTEDVTAVGTKAQNALDLAQTNEKDIGTLDGQVAEIETNLNNKQDKITKNTELALKQIQLDSMSFTIEIGSNSNEYDYGILFASKNGVSTGQLKPSFADEQFFRWLLPAKSGTLATTDDIRVVSSIEVTLTPATATRGTLTDEQLAALLLNDNCYIKLNGLIYTLFKHNDENTLLQYTAGYLNDTRNVQNIKVFVDSKAWTIEHLVLPQAKTYKHHIQFSRSGESTEFFIDIVSSNNLVVDSLTDLKTLLGETFQAPAYGKDATNTEFVLFVTESGYTFFNISQNSLTTSAWERHSFTDTVTKI